MKKLLFIIASVSATLLASCKKEDVKSTPNEGISTTFTCVMADDARSSIDGTTPTWEPGDAIFLYNMKGYETSSGTVSSVKFNANYSPKFYYASAGDIINNSIEEIVLTDSMISADGKVATFTKTIADGDQYCAYASGKNCFNLFSWNGYPRANLFEISAHTDDGSSSGVKLVHAAIAHCTSAQTLLSFKNIYSQIKFDVNGSYKKITFEANEGSTNMFVCAPQQIDLRCNGYWGTILNRSNLYTITLNNQDNGPYYVPVCAGEVLDKGITIKLYASDSDASPRVITTKNTFPAVRNQIVDLGTIDNLIKVDSYYDIFNSGRNITINGEVYNKSTFSGTVTHITEDTALTAGASGIFFVDEGVTLSTNASGNQTMSKDVIIICDKPNAKANFNIGYRFVPQAADLKLIFQNLNITAPSGVFYLGSASTNYPAKWSLHGCRFDIGNVMMPNGPYIKNVEFIDSDISITGPYTALSTGAIEAKMDALTIQNCIIWSADLTNKFRLFNNYTAADFTGIKTSVGSFIVENNTFYDIVSPYNPFFIFAGYDSISFKNNIWAYSSSNASYWTIVTTSNGGLLPTSTVVSGNYRYNTTRASIIDSATRTKTPGITYVEFANAGENPYSTADVGNGIFVKKDSFSAAGATR